MGWESARFELFSAGTKGRRAAGVSWGFPSGRLMESVHLLEASASGPRHVDETALCLVGGLSTLIVLGGVLLGLGRR